MLRCVVAEDEAVIRQALLDALAEVCPELEILAACEDGGEALKAILLHRPDVVFLDIRMPGMSGLEVAQALLLASPSTQIVFVTAYDQYAIDAFEQGAVDYLLKPIANDRLLSSVKRLKARAALGQGHDLVLAALVRQLSAGLPAASRAEPLVWLTASSGAETRLIMVEDVAYFQADNKYTIVMTEQGEAVLRKPIKELLNLLDPQVFKQIHRSTIVNLKAISSVAQGETGKGIVKLKNRPETLSVSQPFMALFRTM